MFRYGLALVLTVNMLLVGLPSPACSTPIAVGHYDIDRTSFELTLKFAGEPDVSSTDVFLRSWVDSSAQGFGGESAQFIGESQIWAAVPGASAVANATSGKQTGDVQAMPVENISNFSTAHAESYYDYYFDVKNLESISVKMNYATSVEVSTNALGETASVGGYCFMRLFDWTEGAPWSFLDTKHEFGIGAYVSDVNHLQKELDIPFLLSYNFGSLPFNGTIRLDGGADLTAWARFKEVSPVPEPGTVLLLGCGLIGLAGLRRKFNK